MNKIFLAVLCSAAVLSLFLPHDVFAGSLLQVNAEPGVSIWLDNEFVGKTTSQQNGLVIADLEPGQYALKATKSGYDETRVSLTLVEGQTVEWRITFAEPDMEVQDIVTRLDNSMVRSGPTGTVVLKSIPLTADIFFNGKNIGSSEKKLTYVPAAEHSVKFVFQKKELAKKFTLQHNEIILIKADFAKGDIIEEIVRTNSSLGPSMIKMESIRKTKPALFPHKKHQEMYACKDCHHGMDSKGKKVAYIEGMEVKHCVTCHNPTMENKKLNSLMQAAHTRCKGCHKKVVQESGSAGPIGKCSGCHIVPENGKP